MQPPNLVETALNFNAAWRLFKRDTTAAQHFTGDRIETVRSFWAALVYLPLFIIATVLFANDMRSDTPALRLFLIETIFYAIGWVAWPLAVHSLTQLFQVGSDYRRYISAYNWSAGPILLLYCALGIADLLFLFSAEVFLLFSIVVLLWSLIYHGFFLRLILPVSTGVMVLFVVCELALGLFIQTLRNGLYL